MSQLAGHYAEAEQLAAELAEEASGEHAATLRISAMRAGIEVRALQGEPAASTLAALERLLDDAARVGALRERALLLTLISDLHARHGAWSDAQRLAREAREQASLLDDVELRADATIRLGTALLDSSPDTALDHFAEAGSLYAAAGHRYGHTRCLVNSGIACQRLGRAGDAELSYREALAMAESANVVDLAGLAAMNLGVLLTRAGRYEAADEQFQRALRSFSKVKNEPRRAAALYNLAHLAYEQGDAAKARDLAQAAAQMAEQLGMHHLRWGAIAGVGLAALALGAQEEVERVANVLEAAVPDQHWFAGRECVEAFHARRALGAGAIDAATRYFARAAEALGGDPYDLAWLVAECAALFRTVSSPELVRLASHARRDAERLGFTPLAKRLALIQVGAAAPERAGTP